MKSILKITVFLSIVSLLFSSCSILDNKEQSSQVKNGTGAVKVIKYSTGTQNIFKAQLKKGPESILSVDCEKLNNAGKAYCEEEKSRVLEWKNEITWESVYKKGPAYISSFDCLNIKSTVGQNYCLDYKKTIKK